MENAQDTITSDALAVFRMIDALDVSAKNKAKLKNAVGFEHHVMSIGMQQQECNRKGIRSPFSYVPTETNAKCQ